MKLNHYPAGLRVLLMGAFGVAGLLALLLFRS